MSKDTLLQELPILIKGCFGIEDLIFCTSTFEEERASQLLFKLRTNDVSFTEFINQCKEFLESKKANKEKIIAEMKKVECYFCSLVRD